MRVLLNSIILFLVHLQCAAEPAQMHKMTNVSNIENSSVSQLKNTTDWRGLRSDTTYILAYQLAAVGVIYLLPQEISGWKDRDKDAEHRSAEYRENIQDIHWDRNNWFVNYIGHPYFGATYFVVARNRGFGKTGSFWYATTMSAIFEYGIEAFFEVPSIQDLVVTPLAGLFVGEYFFQYRNRLKQEIQHKGYSSFTDKSLLFLTDPLGSLNRYFRRMGGRDVTVSLSPYLHNSKRILNKSLKDKYKRSTDIDTQYGIKIFVHW